MLSQETLEQLQQIDFDRLARQEPNGRRRLRLLALAHLKERKNCTEVAQVLRVTRHAVMRWVKWFSSGGMERLAGLPYDWSTQRLPKTQEEAFRQAVDQLQRERGGGAHTRGRYPPIAGTAVCRELQLEWRVRFAQAPGDGLDFRTRR